jgi:hypothetical protein
MTTTAVPRRRPMSTTRQSTPNALTGRPTRLATYATPRGVCREIITQAGAADSTLVIDRVRVNRTDARLVGHLAPDEPPENARLLCNLYVQSADRGRCRPVTDEDVRGAPTAASAELTDLASKDHKQAIATVGCLYDLATARDERPLPELRWRRAPVRSSQGPGRPVRLRDVIAAVESYEPARAMTTRALECHAHDRALSVATLRQELKRLNESPIVLNRGLREAVRAAMQTSDLSLSEIAIRCGRVKFNAHGKACGGQASWLARRIGERPESGQSQPTRWVHSEVLALVARQGLGVAPADVELG